MVTGQKVDFEVNYLTMLPFPCLLPNCMIHGLLTEVTCTGFAC